MQNNQIQNAPLPGKLFNHSRNLPSSFSPSKRLEQLRTLISQIKYNNTLLSSKIQQLKDSVIKRNKKAVTFFIVGGVAILSSSIIFMAPELIEWLMGANSNLPFPFDWLEMMAVTGVVIGVVFTGTFLAIGSIMAGILCTIKNSFDKSKINSNEKQFTNNTALLDYYKDEIAEIKKLEALQFNSSYQTISEVQNDFPRPQPIVSDKAHSCSFFAPPISEMPENLQPPFNSPSYTNKGWVPSNH